jgi:hypothetical protein
MAAGLKPVKLLLRFQCAPAHLFLDKNFLGGDLRGFPTETAGAQKARKPVFSSPL